jgi:hypothetical protein
MGLASLELRARFGGTFNGSKANGGGIHFDLPGAIYVPENG